MKPPGKHERYDLSFFSFFFPIFLQIVTVPGYSHDRIGKV